MPSPTARTLAWCRERGWTACVVEQWVPHTQIRRDAFGWIDILATGTILSAPRSTSIIGIQTTTTGNMAARRKKMRALMSPWKHAGGVALLIGWAQRGPRGKRKVWTAKVETL